MEATGGRDVHNTGISHGPLGAFVTPGGESMRGGVTRINEELRVFIEVLWDIPDDRTGGLSGIKV